MGDDNGLGILLVIGFISGIALGIYLGAVIKQDELEKTAIHVGVAEYYIDKNNEKIFHYFVEPKN